MSTDFQPPFALSARAIHVRVTQHLEHLEVVVFGFKSPQGAVAVVARIGEAIRQSGLKRVLIDVRAVIGQMAAIDHADVGSALASHFGSVRCAVVARADRPRGEIAPTARAGGVDYKAFEEIDPATAWLLQKGQRDAPEGI